MTDEPCVEEEGEPRGFYVVSWRRPDGHVESQDAVDNCSMLLILLQKMNHFKSVWVRESCGGAIVLVYDAYGNLQRPPRYPERFDYDE